MFISSFDKRMFSVAKQEAEKSTFDRFHVGAVIAYKGHIISRGHNSDKTHPLQRAYNSKYRKFNNVDGSYIKHSLHAEIDCITRLPYIIGKEVDFSKAKIYVYRISAGKRLGFGNSKPCPACMNAIRDLGIKDIYFTSDEGYSYLELQ